VYKATPVSGVGAVYCKITKWIVLKVKGVGPKPAHAADLSSRAALALAVPTQSQRASHVPEAVMPQSSEVMIQEAELERARIRRDRYSLEIHKKFSLAAVCVVFALVGAPIALRFPRGGVGVVIGISFTIFALFYVGLTAGEALSDKGIVSPFWAMWAGNTVFLVVGLILYARMGHEGGSARGGDLRELLFTLRQRINGRSALDMSSL
jgi:lipopolysaccharide export system permease protein